MSATPDQLRAAEKRATAAAEAEKVRESWRGGDEPVVAERSEPPKGRRKSPKSEG